MLSLTSVLPSQDALARFKSKHGTNWQMLPEKMMFQLNDTHPTIGVAELQRLLVDVEKLPWDEAKEITKKCLAFTNHTVMPEALERWPVAVMAELLPRHMQIIERMDIEWNDFLRAKYKGEMSEEELEAKITRMSIIQVRLWRTV
jgi:starch phosphorylase